MHAACKDDRLLLSLMSYGVMFTSAFKKLSLFLRQAYAFFFALALSVEQVYHDSSISLPHADQLGIFVTLIATNS